MRKLFLAAASALVLMTGAPAVAKADSSPVVVELFTSEGCSSCPPADLLLGELRQHDDVLALAFHVDYWDYLGWTDRFATKDFTNRQRSYARSLGSPMVYTPQMVVDGAEHVVGSARGQVMEAIADAKNNKTIDLNIGLTWSERKALTVSIPAADYDGEATIWFVRYRLDDQTDVLSGENAGRTLYHANIVEELTAIGMWKGEAMAITLPWEALAADGDHDFGCAIIVQPEGLGPILGAREIVWGPEQAGT